MGTRETYQKTLMHACLVAGGEAALAQRLAAIRKRHRRD